MTTPKHRPGAADHARNQQATLLEEQKQARAHISSKRQHEDARFHALAAATGSYAWTTTIDGQGLDLLDWSTYTGLPLSEGQGDGWRKALHPEDSTRLLSAWQQARQERRNCEATCRLRRSDNRYHRCSVRALPLLGARNQITEWIWSVRELTAEEATSPMAVSTLTSTLAVTDLLVAAFEAVSDGIYILDQARRLLLINAAGRALLGLDAQPDFMAQPFQQLFERMLINDEQGVPFPEEQMPHARILRGEVIPGSQAVDIRVRTLDGREGEFSIAGGPMYDSSGQIIGAVSVIRDMRERRRLERFTHDAMAALLQMVEVLISERELASPPLYLAGDAILRQAAGLMSKVLQLDFIGIAMYRTENDPLQPRAVVGPSPLQESQWWQTLAMSTLPTYVDVSTATRVRAGESCQLAPHWSQNGSGILQRLITPLISRGSFIGLIEVEYHRSSLPDALEQPELLKICARLVALGIEQRRLLHEHLEARASLLALHETNQRMDEFLGIASHELRTPMTSVTLYLDRTAQLMRSRPVPDDPDILKRDQMLDRLQGMLAKAQIQMKRQHRLVNDLLDFSRIHKSWFNLQMELHNLTTLVLEALEEESLLNPARTIQLQRRPREAAMVIVDADRLRQVLSNYLSNALKYSSEDKPIEVILTAEAGVARVSVQDQGRGLSPDEQEHIWEQFYRTPQAQRQNRGGVSLGLGLHICRAIIEQHHGHVGVSSQPGAGSVFWFTIPLAKPE